MYSLISERAKNVEKKFNSRLRFVLYDVYDLSYSILANHLSTVFPHRRFTKKTVCSWYNDDHYNKTPSFEIIREICTFLNVSSDYLFGLSDEFHVHVPVKKIG